MNDPMDETTKRRMARIVIGTLAGAGAAWFLASEKSAGARQQIRKLAVRTKERGLELGHDTAEKTRDLIALGREVNSDEDWKEAIETLEIKPAAETDDSPSEAKPPHLHIVNKP